MTLEKLAVNALVDALNRSTRATPALKIFAWPKYPERELRPQVQPDNSISLALYKLGWNYKFHGKKPSKIPPPADTTTILNTLNAALPDGLTIKAVTDKGEYIAIILQEVPICLY